MNILYLLTVSMIWSYFVLTTDRDTISETKFLCKPMKIMWDPTTDGWHDARTCLVFYCLFEAGRDVIILTEFL